jgi:hypothetical protein
MADITEDALFREIEEDLRRDRLTQLWKRYGAWVMALAVAIVLAVAGLEAWKWWERRQAVAASDRYLAAIELAASDPTLARETLKALASEGPQGYALLARLREAGLAVRQGDFATAAAIYADLETRAPRPAFRDLAIILGGYASLAGSPAAENAQRWQEKLAPLAADGSPWRFSARELLAVIALNGGDRARAKALFSQIASDPQTPANARARAEVVMAQLGEG